MRLIFFISKTNQYILYSYFRSNLRISWFSVFVKYSWLTTVHKNFFTLELKQFKTANEEL